MILEEVTLTVAGRRLAGFQEVNVTRSMDEAAISFALQCTNPAWHPDAFVLRTGAEIELRAGGDLLVKGYVDEYEASHGDGDTHEVRVSGRSKAADSIDCPPTKHKTGRVDGKDLLGVAKEFDEHGVGYTADVALQPIAKVQRHPRDTVFQTIEREARKQGLLLLGEPAGGIRITRAGEKRQAGAILEGAPPLKSFKLKCSAKDKHSPVVVRGQKASGVDGKALRQETQEYDPSVGRYRPLVLFVEGDASEKDLKNRAQWERLRRSGAGVTVSADLATWRDAAGALFEPGRLIAVTLHSERFEQDMTISSVTFTQSHAGTTASPDLVDPRSHGGKAPKGKSDKAYAVKAGTFNGSGR